MALHGFKSIEELEIDPLSYRVNVFIGKNGSGKSNILNVVRTLKDSFQGKEFDPFNLSFNRSDTKMGFTISLSLNEHDLDTLLSGTDMGVVLSAKEVERLGMHLKVLTYELRFMRPGFMVWSIISKDGMVLMDDGSSGISNQTLLDIAGSRDRIEPVLERGVMTPFVELLVEHFKEHFRNAFIYDPLTAPQNELDLVLGEFIRHTGVDEGILFPREAKTLEGRVLQECKRLVPSLEKIFVEPDGTGSGRVRFLLGGTDHSTREVSEGTRKVLTLILRLYDPDCTLVVIDSPENNIYPETQSLLFDIMKHSSKQVFVATHSIEFISHEPTVNVYKVLRKGHKASTKVEAVEGVISDVTRLSGTRIFFLDRILLVEGPTDKVVLERYLEILGLDDMEIAIIPCLGETNFKFFANIVNIQMLGVSLSKVQILTDNDNRPDKKEEIRRAIDRHFEEGNSIDANKVGIHVLKRFSIENYLEPYLLARVLKQEYGLEVSNHLKKRLRSNNPRMDIKSEILIHVFKVKKHELKGMTALYRKVLRRMNRENTHPKRLAEMDRLLRAMLGMDADQ